jgi:hypothetical protein
MRSSLSKLIIPLFFIMCLTQASVFEEINQEFLKQIITKAKHSGSQDDESADIGLSFDQIVTRKNYPLSSHWVTTDDGYILKLYRIRGPKGTTPVERDPTRKVVLLQHGLLVCLIF